MNKCVLVFSVWLCLTAIAVAGHIDVSGDVSGTWSADTVLVLDDIRVPPSASLVIEPGTVVLFNDHFKFVVDAGAVLLAVGTPSDTIVFDEGNEGIGWHGIRFLGASNSSLLEYCHLISGIAVGAGNDAFGGGVYVSNCEPKIRYSVIEQCSAEKGGGIYAGVGSLPTIEFSIIHDNVAIQNGGAVYLDGCTGRIYDCTVCDNFAGGQGGIYSDDGRIEMVHTIAYYNETVSGQQLTLDGTSTEVIWCCLLEGGFNGEWSKDPQFCDHEARDYHLPDCSDFLAGNNACANQIGALGAGCVCTDVEAAEIELPAEYALRQNYPNPFNPITTIEFSLPRRSAVDISVYDLLGRKIEVLVSRTMEAGNHRVTWDGRYVASGIYLYRFTAGDFVSSRKMLLLK